MNELALRKYHRWLGLLAGIQLLAWTVSGLYFTLIPIDVIHGDHLLPRSAEMPEVGEISVISVSELGRRQPLVASTSLDAVRLLAVGGDPVYVVQNQRFDARDGRELLPLSQAEAEAEVARRSESQVVSSEWVTEVPKRDEYRGGELPAWRVIVAGSEDAAIYVGATTGRVRAVRTDAWRLFDFLWSLHIMDYDEREDFNHWLIKLMAILGLVTVISGLILFVLVQKRRWRRS